MTTYFVMPGEMLSGIVLDPPDTELVAFGGTAVDTTIHGGIQDDAGAATGTTIYTGYQYVEPGGVASNTMMYGGAQFVFAGGTAIATTINGGAQDDFGTAIGTIINGGGVEFVEAGAVASGTVNNGGTQYVNDGGTARDTTMNGGVQIVFAGGTVIATTINGGAQDDFGTAIGTIINAGRFEFVEAGGVASGTVINAGTQDVFAGGSAANTAIYGGLQLVEAGAIASGTAIHGGNQAVMAGATASGAIISGGFQDDFGSTIGTTINSSGTEIVEAGASAAGTIINGGLQDDIGAATSTTINGGMQRVEIGATATNTTVNGGFQDDYGSAIGTTINRGGTEVIEQGGTATGTVIAGGTQGVSGTASNTTISAGLQRIEFRGIATSTTINGGFQDDYGSATGTTVNAGAAQIVEFGAIANNTVINGGLEYVNAGGIANGVTFAGHTGTLQLRDPASLTGTISGWQRGDEIDFLNGQVTSAAISGSTLQVTMSGGQSFSYHLAGQESGTIVQLSFGSQLRLVAKAPPAVTESLVNDTGISNTDRVTSNPALAGSGDANATVHFTIDGTPLAATVTADAFGNWRYTPAGLADGTHTIVTSETDAAGQTGAASLTFILDIDTNVTPTFVVAGGAPVVGIANLNAISFAVAGLDDETGTTTFSDGLHSVTVAVSGNGTFTANLSTLNAPTITSTLTVGDVAGNTFVAAGNLLAIDSGPTVGTGTATVGHNQTIDLTRLVNGLIIPGMAGDSETLLSVGAANGAASLSNGTIAYTAATNGSDTLSFTVADQYGDTATGTVNVTIDPGPTAGAASIMVAAGVSIDLTAYLLGLDRPGMPGDTLSLVGAGTAGTRGTVTLANGLLVYAAPAPGSDSFSYTVTDQYGDTASVPVTISAVTTGNMGNVNGTLVLGNNSANVGFGRGTVTVIAGNGNITINGGTADDTVIVGNGNDTVTLGGGNNTVTLGSGTDSVTLGGGNNTLYLGAGHDTVGLGNGNNTLILTNGTYDVSAGHGTNLFEFSGPQALLNLSFAGNDELVFRATGFDLGAENGLGTATPQPIAASLFSSLTDGTFATPDNRFAYASATGKLYYDADGSSPGSTSVLVANLSNHPHLGAANLFFTS